MNENIRLLFSLLLILILLMFSVVHSIVYVCFNITLNCLIILMPFINEHNREYFYIFIKQ